MSGVAGLPVPRIATIVLSWNNRDDTIECLESLAKVELAGVEHEVVVVDNGSTDGSPDRIVDRFPEVTMLRNRENLGFAGGNNVGMTYALNTGADFIVLLNNDAVVEPDCYARLLERARSGDRIGAVTPLIRYYAGNREVWHAGAKLIRPFGRVQPFAAQRSAEPYRVQVFTACCVMIASRVLESIGIFDERFFLYLEDTDLALRIQDRGFETWLVPDAVVYHKVSRSSGGRESPAALYYAVRNNLLLIRERSIHRAERYLGYGYMSVLTVKIMLNVILRGLPQKHAVAGAVVQGWADFVRSNWGQRR